MSTVHDWRKANLREVLVRRFKGFHAWLAREAHMHPNQISLALTDNPRLYRPMTEKLARKIEERLELPSGWLDRKPRKLPGIPTRKPESPSPMCPYCGLHP